MIARIRHLVPPYVLRPSLVLDARLRLDFSSLPEGAKRRSGSHE